MGQSKKDLDLKDPASTSNTDNSGNANLEIPHSLRNLIPCINEEIWLYQER